MKLEEAQPIQARSFGACDTIGDDPRRGPKRSSYDTAKLGCFFHHKLHFFHTYQLLLRRLEIQVDKVDIFFEKIAPNPSQFVPYFGAGRNYPFLNNVPLCMIWI